jgi:hypothetical protein
MMNKLCDWTQTDTGSLICSITAAVGGLHLLLTAPQPVLSFLPKFSTTFMGREVGAQQLVGAVLTVCGICAFGACCMPKKETLIVVGE